MTADCFILLGKDQTDRNLLPARILLTQSKTVVSLLLHSSFLCPGFPEPKHVQKHVSRTEEKEENGQGSTGRGGGGGREGQEKMGSLLLGVCCRLTACFRLVLCLARGNGEGPQQGSDIS